MPAGIDLLNRSIGLIGKLFGTVSITIDGELAADGALKQIAVDWNSLGRTEVVELAGKRVSFSCTIDASKDQFSHEPVQGKRVTRVDTGAVYRIVGPINGDDLTYRIALDSVNK